MKGPSGLHRLTSLKISKTFDPGYYADGGGLYLQITKSGARSWIFKFMLAKRAREMGLGPLAATSLAEARASASQCRKRLTDGGDPLEHRKISREKSKTEFSGVFIFMRCAQDYIDTNKVSWKNPKHIDQWINALTTYAYPTIGGLSLHELSS